MVCTGKKSKRRKVKLKKARSAAEIIAGVSPVVETINRIEPPRLTEEQLKKKMEEAVKTFARCIREFDWGTKKRERKVPDIKPNKGATMPRTKEQIKKDIAEKKAKIKSLEFDLEREEHPDAVLQGDTVFRNNIPHTMLKDTEENYMAFANKETNELYTESLDISDNSESFISIDFINDSMEGNWTKLPE